MTKQPSFFQEITVKAISSRNGKIIACFDVLKRQITRFPRIQDSDLNPERYRNLLSAMFSKTAGRYRSRLLEESPRGELIYVADKFKMRINAIKIKRDYLGERER